MGINKLKFSAVSLCGKEVGRQPKDVFFLITIKHRAQNYYLNTSIKKECALKICPWSTSLEDSYSNLYQHENCSYVGRTRTKITRKPFTCWPLFMNNWKNIKFMFPFTRHIENVLINVFRFLNKKKRKEKKTSNGCYLLRKSNYFSFKGQKK